jgi:hypothetical protein
VLREPLLGDFADRGRLTITGVLAVLNAAKSFQCQAARLGKRQRRILSKRHASALAVVSVKQNAETLHPRRCYFQHKPVLGVGIVDAFVCRFDGCNKAVSKGDDGH